VAVTSLEGFAGLEPWLSAAAPPGTLLLTLGAGDIGRQVARICGRLDARGEG
jgi:hypothetical protein